MEKPDEVLEELIEEIAAQSERHYVPAIDGEDAAALAALAFTADPGLMVDLGAGVGYSTLWMAIGARGKPAARIIAVEWDEDLVEVLRRNADAIREATGVSVDVVNSDAVDYLESLDEGVSFTLSFIDVEKHIYPQVFDLLRRHVSKGGLIAFHNAYYPSPPKEFYEKISGYTVTVIPTTAGLGVIRV